MPDVTIKIDFTADRWQTGTLSLVDKNGATLAGPFRTLGKADNANAAAKGNPTRNPLRRWGDTPTGTYRVVRLQSSGPGTNYPAYNYGPDAVIVLDPLSGDALTAKQNGRTGLLIHGGAPGENGRLRATHGCIRLSNADMAALLLALRAASNNATQFRCEAIDVSVTVGEPSDDTAGPDMSDPPPGIDDLIAPLPFPWG